MQTQIKEINFDAQSVIVDSAAHLRSWAITEGIALQNNMRQRLAVFSASPIKSR